MFGSAGSANIIAGISRRSDGNMTVYPAPGDDQPAENRRKFFSRLGCVNQVVGVQMVHGSKVATVGAGQRGQILSDYDALITDEPQVVLSLTVADCLPIYFYDQRRQAIALAHAGWRGVLANISREVVNKFIELYKTDPGDLEIHIGPHIHICHFEVKDDVANQFAAYPQFVSRSDKIFIDLAGVVREQLMAAGIKAGNIDISQECTHDEKDQYFSYRRDGGEFRVMAAYLGLKRRQPN
ncbi:MAG: peptidoglycan editing factor PgeF [Patescibacteria group bacterium]